MRSLKILEQQSAAGALKNALIDVCDEIEGGATLSEAMAKSPKAFNRLYVNMIKAGEAGGALEVILKRLAEFQERSETLKRKVKGALVYPIVVVTFATGILIFIMMWIVPKFEKIFKDFGVDPAGDDENADQHLVLRRQLLVSAAGHSAGDLAGDEADPQVPRRADGLGPVHHQNAVFGPLVEKNIVARTMRTLGTLVASGVPILEALHITKETSGNCVFENLFQKVYESIREGESIAKPMKDNSKPPFHPMAMFFWFFWPPVIGVLLYLTRMNKRVLDDMVINMVDVGEETGELDTMLYKVADTYDEEVAVLTESLMSLMEPLMIIVLGGMVGFIVIALFLPLISPDRDAQRRREIVER